MGFYSLILLIVSLITNLIVIHSFKAVLCPPDFFCNDRRLSFPFKAKTHPPECGLFTVDCSQPSGPKIQMEEGYWHELQWITVVEGSKVALIHINDAELQKQLDSCHDEAFSGLRIPSPSLELYNLSTQTASVFQCENTLLPDDISYWGLNLSCSNAVHTYYISSGSSLQKKHREPPCSIIKLPIQSDTKPPNSLSGLTANFTFRVEVMQDCFQCHRTDGTCRNDIHGNFQCFRGENMRGSILQVSAVAGFVAVVIIAVVIIAGLFLRGNLSFDRSILILKKQDLSCKIVKAFLMNYGPLQIKRYSYLDIKKMTNSFKKKLGQGGFGSVYEGKLPAGSLVAVKVLNRSKGNGEEFMNEVAAISRTSHVNIVSLLGFCFEGSKKALIYEFMHNGSLEKFIFDTKIPQNHLGWETLEKISLGIARGLEYLHRGCNTRILHFDIKPHNILLDENFLPKISDFGLARICDRKDSIVSMSGARGTAGYIAPEVFCRNFGGVSHKSDVYSYGMMLSEMAGARRNINVEDTSEIYFPHCIYKRLEMDQELGLQGIMNDEDKVRARKLIMVSLWCIQTNPLNRPGIKEVIEMLEGSVESLQMPPKPYLSSPPKSPAVADSSTALVSIQ